MSDDAPRYSTANSTDNEGVPSNIEVQGLSGDAMYSFVRDDDHAVEFRPTGAALNDGVRLLWRTEGPVVVKNGYQYKFRPDGTLDRIIDGSGAGLIMGISQGQLYVQLRYSLNPKSGPVVNRAQLFVVGEENPRQVVDYSYDEKGRLVDADVTVDGAGNSSIQRK